ncbi:hypothetical protein BXZ70DRAFT_794107 [Cristinia sonorae]|uniref:Uncharacterized protein n=1 Tax=Cristinia sonorae TaxID=1940300 RepID=A0A8K0UU17_9AGAR|nr:hypothetical protein BXZ70DRAFT_794107 [Cristinia sonorae]
MPLTMPLFRRDANDTMCPPTIPHCNPSVGGPGPALVLDRNANTLIRKPNDTKVNTQEADDDGSQAEINIIGVVIIIIMIFVLFSLWAGLAKWPRGKIRGCIKGCSEGKREKARRKAMKANKKADMAMVEEGLGSTPSAVDLTRADIESAVNALNARVISGELHPIPPPAEKTISVASTVVPIEGGEKENSAFSKDNSPLVPPKALIRESSLPDLPSITPGSPFGSMRFNAKK